VLEIKWKSLLLLPLPMRRLAWGTNNVAMQLGQAWCLPGKLTDHRTGFKGFRKTLEADTYEIRLRAERHLGEMMEAQPASV